MWAQWQLYRKSADNALKHCCMWCGLQVDSFTVEGAAVHSPCALKVTLQATQQSPSWHLDHVVCTVLEGGKDSTAGRKYYFLADR